jgi:nicotinamidase-related amidase
MSARQNQPQTEGFRLSTEQFEILLAFEAEGSLSGAARRVRRDVSVVSRTLKAIAESAPLVEKHQGKWRMTLLGRQFNRLTHGFLQTQAKLLLQGNALRLTPHNLPSLGQASALVLLGTQRGFQSPVWGPRNNPDAETKMALLLAQWRKRERPVVFCQHQSRKSDSPLRPGTGGNDFIPALAPQGKETVIAKAYNSAFTGTRLEAHLKARSIRNLILVGFTTNHCIDATARSAFDAGFNVFVISDAVATFDRVGPDGKNYPAEALHGAALASLHQEYASILDSDLFLRYLTEEEEEADASGGL